MKYILLAYTILFTLQVNAQTASEYFDEGSKKAQALDFAGSIQQCNKAIELEPDWFGPYVLRGMMKIQLEDYLGAIQDLNKTLELHTDFPIAYYYRGEAYGNIQEHLLAIIDYSRYIELQPMDNAGYHSRGDNKAILEDYTGALQDFSISIELNPMAGNSYRQRGQVKTQLEDYDGAIQDFTTAIELDPEDKISRSKLEYVTELKALLENLHKAIGPSIPDQELEEKDELANSNASSKIGQIGTMAPDFVQNDITDKPVALSSFKGKYVLLYFWASWSEPCNLENQNVAENFIRFKNKNFTVLGVSLDQDKSKWLAAIQNEELNWSQVSDLQGWNNSVAILYGLEGIPQNFLIDPEGKIVAKNLRGTQLEITLCELMGCK